MPPLLAVDGYALAKTLVDCLACWRVRGISKIYIIMVVAWSLSGNMKGHCAIIVNRNDGNLGFTWRRRPLTMQMRFRIRRICQTNPVRTLRRSRTVGGAGCYSGRRLRRRSLLAWLWRCGRTWTSRQRIGFLDLKRYGKSLRKDA